MNLFTDHQEIETRLRNSGFGDYIDSHALQRLKGISYLATMDNIYGKPIRYTRYEHSLGVGYVALMLSERLQLNNEQSRTLVIINLTHDIGHVAFSHAAETFVLEKYRRYHNGLKTSFYSTSQSEATGSIEQQLSKEPAPVRTNVKDYIFSNKTSDALLNAICECSINCDRVEGTNRSLFALGDQYIDPKDLIDVFAREGDRLYVFRDSVPLIFRFWELQELLYNKYIYTYEVLASEAMLTRALELVFNDSDNDDLFLTCSDVDVQEKITKNKAAEGILKSFYNKEYFIPLSQCSPDILSKYEKTTRQARFDNLQRKAIEKAIASEINCEPEYVITHFSYKKHFFTDRQELAQLPLFDRKELLNVDTLNKSIYKKNVSGEIFEVFVKVGASK